MHQVSVCEGLEVLVYMFLCAPSECVSGFRSTGVQVSVCTK